MKTNQENKRQVKTDEEYAAEYQASFDLQKEFRTEATYVAFQKNYDAGRIRIKEDKSKILGETKMKTNQENKRQVKTDEEYAAEYQASFDLQKEFRTEATYVAFQKNYDAGRIRIKEDKRNDR